MLTMKSLEELIELTQTPALLQTVRFGEFRGTQWRDVDTEYLDWITRRDFGADELHTARYWLAQRGGRGGDSAVSNHVHHRKNLYGAVSAPVWILLRPVPGRFHNRLWLLGLPPATIDIVREIGRVQPQTPT